MNYEEVGRQRVVFHQAGHVVAAYPLAVPVERISVATGDGWRPGVQLGSLYQAMLLASDGPERQRVLHNHLVVRLAGHAAEMIYTLNRFRATGHRVSRTRWRIRWGRSLLFGNEPDADFAYAALMAWSNCRTVHELRQTFEELWRDTELLLRKDSVWSQVELLAAVLKVRPIMSGAEAFAVIRPLAP